MTTEPAADAAPTVAAGGPGRTCGLLSRLCTRDARSIDQDLAHV